MYINYDVNRLANVWLHNSEKKTHTNIAGSCQNETNLSSFRNRVKIFLDFSHFPVIFTTNTNIVLTYKAKHVRNDNFQTLSTTLNI